MAAQSTGTTRLSRRTRIVWASFVAAMTVVTGLLAIGDGGFRTGFPAISLSTLPGSADPARTIFETAAELDRERWQGIVIHHSGTPADDAESIHRRHLGYGFQGLGYHFVIGNGNGMSDGVVHVGYRWNDQLPGAHASGPDAERYNQRAIAICVVGNGERRPFTDRQISELITLVRQLQRELGIPAEAVHLHRDVGDGVASPGRFFPAARFEEQLITRPR